MMGTTADKLEYLQGTKAAIKQAIVNKGVAVPDGTTFRGYAEKIGAIIDVPDLSNPGAAGDLRSGRQLVGADGSIVTGTLPEVIQATPTISVSSGGLITASATQSGGIVTAGSKSTTQQLTTQGAKTVTPGTAAQTAVASGRYTTGDVKVAGDANLKAENIAEGVSIFGVQGTHSGGGSAETNTISVSPVDAGKYYEYEAVVSMEGKQNIVCYTKQANSTPNNTFYLTAFYIGGVVGKPSAYGSDSIEVAVIGDTATISGNRNTGGTFQLSYSLF